LGGLAAQSHSGRVPPLTWEGGNMDWLRDVLTLIVVIALFVVAWLLIRNVSLDITRPASTTTTLDSFFLRPDSLALFLDEGH
jgi:hypothetical protein